MSSLQSGQADVGAHDSDGPTDSAPQPKLPLIGIVTPCYNEEQNVEELARRVRDVMQAESGYRYQHTFIDNASTDSTVEVLRGMAAADPNLRVIVNARNFGHIRSPYHGILTARGRAVIFLACDLQDPPEMLTQFLRKWEEGFKVVVGVKTGSEEAKPMFLLRKFYYSVIARFAEVKLIKNFTGFGLYDRLFIQKIRRLNDPYPYFRGIISEIGYTWAEIEFYQPLRKRGVTKNNFYTLYDIAMLGMTSHSKVPLRLATMLGFLLGALNLCVGLVYFCAKLIWWDNFSLGIAPLIIGMFTFTSIQLIFLGIVGEYLGAVYTKVMNRPLVVEKERINDRGRRVRRRRERDSR